MRSPALAIGWELWARNRLGLSCIGALAVVAAVVVQVLPAHVARDWVAPPTVVLGCFGYVYLMWVFVYAESTLASRGIGFPPRLFTAPVSTVRLVVWPMLYGMAAVAAGWLWIAWLIALPYGYLMNGWHALVFASSLAAFQALCWTIVRSPLLRLFVGGFVLPLVALRDVFLWFMFKRELSPAEIGTKAGAIALGSYAVAMIGVSLDRRGFRPFAGRLRESLALIRDRIVRAQQPFGDPGAAQCWLEMRLHVWLVSLLVGLYLLTLSMATPSFAPVPRDLPMALVVIVGLPPLFALFLGFGVGKAAFWSRDLRLASFIATRPVTSEALAVAKLDTMARCAARTWVYLLILVPYAALALGKAKAVAAVCDALFPGQADWKLGLLAPVALAGLVGMTWMHLVAGACASLSGRVWLVNATALFYIAMTALLVETMVWVFNLAGPLSLNTLIAVLWWAGGGLLVVKVAGVARTLKRTWHCRTVPLLAVWLAIVTCLLIPIYSVLPEDPVPPSLVAVYAILAVPLSRPLLLPAAIAWNRHR
jgi:hypothetical protein